MNIYRALLSVLPQTPLEVGTVTLVAGPMVQVTLPGGAVISARGSATLGQRVFVRDGVIEGQAPQLPVVTLEI